MLKLTLLSLFLCCFQICQAQPRWESKGPLYEDKDFAVEVEYAMGNSPCGMVDMPSQYRYKVTRNKTHRPFYLQWRFDYFNCEHLLKTRLNTVLITQGTRTGYIVPNDNQFSALRLVNNFNAVQKLSQLPAVTAYTPVSAISLEPKAIQGKLTIRRGESTTLSLAGGYLAPGSYWEWYENSCGGTPIKTGPSLVVSPQKTTTYTVRAQGIHPTTCVITQVIVADINLAPDAIEGKKLICPGEKNVLLTMKGGSLTSNARWVWRQDGCDGPVVGTGTQIRVSPEKTTTYYVRGEGQDGNTECQVFTLTIAAASTAAIGIDVLSRTNLNDSLRLAVQGGSLSADAQWVWYAGPVNHKQQIGTGNLITIPFSDQDITYYVRAEGPCSMTGFAFRTIQGTRIVPVTQKADVPKDKPAHPYQSFINGGVVSNDLHHLNQLKNYVATLGGGTNVGWFIRAKISGETIRSDYQSSGTQIPGYNMPGYYQYTQATAHKRTGYTAGAYFGSRHLAVYVDGGYGQRELFYSINQYNYGSAVPFGSAWVKNTARSYSGAEIEGGLLIKAGPLNLMGGVSTLQGKYTDINVGIGLNF